MKGGIKDVSEFWYHRVLSHNGYVRQALDFACEVLLQLFDPFSSLNLMNIQESLLIARDADVTASNKLCWRDKCEFGSY